MAEDDVGWVKCRPLDWTPCSAQARSLWIPQTLGKNLEDFDFSLICASISLYKGERHSYLLCMVLQDGEVPFRKWVFLLLKGRASLHVSFVHIVRQFIGRGPVFLFSALGISLVNFCLVSE